MFNDSKTIFITHPYYAVNNPDNNLRIYHKVKNSNKWTFIQCKTKEEYRQKIKQYIIGFFDYSRNEEKTVAENDVTFDMPLVILANENSASASEILIGALKDNEKATIIGKKTYGKGVIQTVISLSDGSGLKLTTAEYYTPNGSAIHEVGIEPDIEVELPDTVINIYSISEDEDTQLNKAIEVLSQEE